MMKYKILVNGENSALLRDFFVNAPGFICMSTSSYWADLTAHYRMFGPDAYVCLAEFMDIQVITQAKKLKANEEFYEVPIILITNEDCFEDYYSENESEPVFDVILSRPISIKAIGDRIVKHLLYIEEEKEKEQKRIAREKEEREAMEEAARMAALASIENGSSLSNEKKHILVVDDDKNVLKLLKSALEEKYTVTAIAGGRMALRFLETKTPDLIFLDYQMPVENGPEVFKKIRKMESAQDIPIVFLTGIADREKITEVLSLKPQGYLLKPINMERVNDTIRSILG